MKISILLASILLASCGTQEALYNVQTKKSLLPYNIVETEDGLLITEGENPDEAIFTASALLIARCASHPACRGVIAEGGKTILKFAVSTAASGMTWDWANKHLCNGSCYDFTIGQK